MNKKIIMLKTKKTILLIFTLHIWIPVHSQTLNAKKFGLKEQKDATPAILKAIEACKQQNAKKLIIPKGTYNFYPDKAFEAYVHISNHDDGLKRIAFPIHGFNNLKINARGSNF